MQITVNQPGARTIRDTRPMTVDGQPVYVTVEGGIANLIINGFIAAQMDADTMTPAEAQEWAIEYLAATNAAGAPDLDAVAEAVNEEAVYAGAVEQVRSTAIELNRLAQQADKEAARQKNGRRAFGTNDPRHPANRAAALRRDAVRLAAWTTADEVAYVRYISDGLSDTDGYFGPLDRAAWKATVGA